MLIIGCDYHPGFQQIAFVDTDTGELSERRLAHREEAEQFYRELKQQNLSVRVGMESSGHSRWFERLLGELGFELWIGDPAEIRTKRVRKQRTDRQDAQLLLRLMLENRFPRIWVPRKTYCSGGSLLLGIRISPRSGRKRGIPVYFTNSSTCCLSVILT